MLILQQLGSCQTRCMRARIRVNLLGFGVGRRFRGWGGLRKGLSYCGFEIRGSNRKLWELTMLFSFSIDNSLTWVGIFERIIGRANSIVDYRQDALVEVVGGVQQACVLGGEEVIVWASDRIWAATGTLKPCRILWIGTGGNRCNCIDGNELETVQWWEGGGSIRKTLASQCCSNWRIETLQESSSWILEDRINWWFYTQLGDLGQVGTNAKDLGCGIAVDISVAVVVSRGIHLCISKIGQARRGKALWGSVTMTMENIETKNSLLCLDQGKQRRKEDKLMGKHFDRFGAWTHVRNLRISETRKNETKNSRPYMVLIFF